MNLSYFDVGGGSPGPSIVAGAQYNWTKNWLAGLNISYHRTGGTDYGTINAGRDYEYRSNLFEITGRATFMYHFKPYPIKPWSRKINPFAYAGGGILQFQPDLYFHSTGDKIDITDNYLIITPVINFGLGIFYNINRFWSFSVEGGTNFPFSDYIEGYSNEFYSKSRDMYHTISLRIIWKEPLGFSGLSSISRH